MATRNLAVVVVGTAAATVVFTLAMASLLSRPHVAPGVEPQQRPASPVASSSLGAGQRAQAERQSMRARMREVLQAERTRAPRTEPELRDHLAQLEADARAQGRVTAVEIAAGHGALERAGASAEEIDAFLGSMERLSAELRGAPLPSAPAQADADLLAALKTGEREAVVGLEGSTPEVQDAAMSNFVGTPDPDDPALARAAELSRVP